MSALSKFAVMLVPTGMLAFGSIAFIEKSTGSVAVVDKYDVRPVARGLIRKVVTAAGQVRAQVSVQVSSQLSGLITQLPADFNSEVKKGDVLARLDDKSYLAREAAARAELSMAEADLAAHEAAMAKAAAIRLQAGRVVSRRKQLAADGIASVAELDRATSDEAAAAADAELTSAQIARAKANIAHKRALLEQAKRDLERTVIRAPIDGTVISRSIDIGQTIAASLQAPELFRIARDLRSIKIETHVSEADVGSIQAGNPALFTVDAYPDRQFSGQVVQVRLGGIEQGHVVTYMAVIEAANPDRALLPGMTASVRIETERRDDVLRISSDALYVRPKRSDTVQGWQAVGDELRRELRLSEVQAGRLFAQLKETYAETRATQLWRSVTGAIPPAQANLGDEARWDKDDRLDRIVGAVLTRNQLSAYAAWKARLEQNAEQQGQPGTTIWVVTDRQRLEARRVRVGMSGEDFTEVTGLTEGDRVVVRVRRGAAP